MTAEFPFETLPESEQNRLLRKIALQLRPMLGEIGEVLVTPRASDKKKPGFLGFLFKHNGDKAILFAEYVHQPTREQFRTATSTDPTHVFMTSRVYVANLLAAGKSDCVGASDSLSIASMGDDIKESFRMFYGAEIDGADFRIKLQAIGFKKPDGDIQAALYFASKQGEEFNLEAKTVATLARLVEQLIRNALGLAAISDHELGSTVGYLTAKLPQSFDDYVMPQALAAIYAYVREVVPVTLGEKIFPIVASADGTATLVREPLKSIHRASHIQVNRAVGGSLKGASVFSLKITTKGRVGDSTTSYPAIAKFSTVSEARDEADGLRKLQRYFSRIGMMLPPPLEVYLLKDTNGIPLIDQENWLKTKCISVTPDLEGGVLSEKIAEHWASPTGRVERFSRYLRQAKRFVDEIQSQPLVAATEGADSGTAAKANNPEMPQQRIIDYIKKSESDVKRFKVLTTTLDFPTETLLKLPGQDCVVVNPIAWLTQMIDDSSKVQWKQNPGRIPKMVLAHGDFHTGNLFYRTDGEHLTVLDYDRVTGEHPEEDFARLDASFVAFVFALDDFKRSDNWNKYALPAISLVAGCHPSMVEALEMNAFARDLVETIAVIRPAKACPFYAASVVKALLSQLKTTYTKWDESAWQLADKSELTKNQGRSAASWLYLALMLRHLVETGTGAATAWQKPYESVLPKT